MDEKVFQAIVVTLYGNGVQTKYYLNLSNICKMENIFVSYMLKF